MDVCTPRHWQTAGRLVHKLNVSTVLWVASQFDVHVQALTPVKNILVVYVLEGVADLYKPVQDILGKIQ